MMKLADALPTGDQAIANVANVTGAGFLVGLMLKTVPK
jgi:hypothetical protein